jgi:uncharacterized protein (UPF0335 family)
MAKPTRPVIGRNTAAGRALQEIIEKVERIRQQKKELGDEETAVMASAKAAGFDTTTIRNVIKRRAAKPEAIEEAQTNLDNYLHAIGMAYETPLFRSVGMMNVDLAARDEVIEAFKLLVPTTGEIRVHIGAQPVRLWRDKDGEAHAEDIDDTPAPASQPKRPSGLPERPARDVPDVDEDGAYDLGRAAFRNNEAIVSNPFPWDDKRRQAFDKGWRAESGGDGMGPEDDE